MEWDEVVEPEPADGYDDGGSGDDPWDSFGNSPSVVRSRWPDIFWWWPGH
jgi:hypothetical protein